MNPVPAVPTLSRTALVERRPVPCLLPPRRGGDRGQVSTKRADPLRTSSTVSQGLSSPSDWAARGGINRGVWRRQAPGPAVSAPGGRS